MLFLHHHFKNVFKIYSVFELTKLKRYLFSILGGLLMVLSFPFTGSLPLLMLFAFIPLLLIEETILHRKYRASKLFIHSYIVFFIYNVGTTWWIWNASIGGAIFAFTLNSLIMALVFQAFHITKKHVGKYEGNIALVIFWIGFEYLHFHWELSWPWLNLGNVFASSPILVQWYSISGILGGTAWVLVCNLLGFNILKNVFFKNKTWASQKQNVLILFAGIILPISFSLIQYYSYSETGKDTEIVITQPNIDPYNEKFTGSVNDQLDKICSLADKKVTTKTDFVLAPETALPFMFYEDEIQRIIYFHYLIERKAIWNGPSLLIGASTKKYFKTKNSRASKKIYGGPGFEEYYNSSMLLDEYDNPKFVHKSKLVLGVEKVPFSNVFPYLEELSINNGGTSGTLGVEDESQVLSSKGIKFAPVVCYESIYGEFISDQCNKGAELIFVITNDGWWGNTPGYKQHNAFSRLRAIENRRSVARSGNTGISSFINQRGDVLQASSWWVETSIKETVKRNSEKTFYTRYGDIIGQSLSFSALFLFLFTLYKIIYRRFKK
jgi:apolipoprotein N-acyltransferase